MPAFAPLSQGAVSAIVDDALVLLDRVGIAVHDSVAATLLLEHGAVGAAGRLRIPPDLVRRALGTAPSVVRLFDAAGTPTHEIGGDHQYFTPGSSAVSLLDGATQQTRTPNTADYVTYVRLVEGLPHFASQSTAFVPGDVPAPISDSYRLYLSLLHGTKPIITGTFSTSSCAVMEDLLVAVRGSRAALVAKPLAVYTCCPTTPLAWSAESVGTVIACARAGIPVEIVPMPLAGFIAPMSLAGTLVQHAAEALSGLVLTQLAAPGAPALFGCAATIFDVRCETTPLGAAEGMLLACGAAQVGRALNLPTQAYVGLSDAKLVDMQAGLETGMGAALAALGGINQIAGAGMLDFVNTFSLEKLVIDHEICAMAVRLRKGIAAPPPSILPLVEELLEEGHLLIAQDTRRRLREEMTMPGAAIDRASRQRWAQEGSARIGARAAAEIARIVDRYPAPSTCGRPDAIASALTERMRAEARRHGMQELPEAQCVT